MGSIDVPQHGLASQNELTTNGIKVHDKCVLCMDGFSSTHVQSSFATPGSCKHVFGEKCLMEWFSIASTCPVCRVVLVHSASVDRRISESEREHLSKKAHFLSVPYITDRLQALDFMKKIRGELEYYLPKSKKKIRAELEYKWEPSESDSEDEDVTIYDVLFDCYKPACNLFEMPTRIPPADLVEALIRIGVIMKKMLWQIMYRVEGIPDARLRTYWTVMMGHALG